MDKQMKRVEWFFEEGCKTMNKLQQVEYLINYCGHPEDSAYEIIYGAVEADEPEDSYDYTPEDYYGD